MTDTVRDILADRGGIAAAGAAFGDGFAAGVDRSRRRSYRDDRPASAWPGVFVALVIVAGVLAGVVLFNGGYTFGCDADCSAARANIASVNAYRDISIANANANARAGFGNHDLATQQYAVPAPAPPPPASPPVVNVTVPAPVVNVPAPIVNIAPVAPVATVAPAAAVIPPPSTWNLGPGISTPKVGGACRMSDGRTGIDVGHGCIAPRR